jgi:hypothetical protein
MTPVWAQRKEELWSDCIVSPDVFNPIVERVLKSGGNGRSHAIRTLALGQGIVLCSGTGRS